MNETVTPQADSYELGFVLGIRQAKKDQCVPGDEAMSRLALDTYENVIISIHVNKQSFLVGYVAGWQAWNDGIA